MDPDESPKLVITTNFTINSISRSDKRRQFFVPIGTYYGTLWDGKHKTPADVHGGYLLDKQPGPMRTGVISMQPALTASRSIWITVLSRLTTRCVTTSNFSRSVRATSCC